tara:strand:- start:17 stop:322 length:306 start_codon:yes stop_codon:yes gene_type:complete
MKENKMNELDLFRYELIFDGTTGEEFAKSIGMSYPSYKNVVRNGSKVIPKWVLAFLFGRGYSYVGDALVKNKTSSCDTTSGYVDKVIYNGKDVVGVSLKTK